MTAPKASVEAPQLELRESPGGVVAIRGDRRFSDRTRPWSVVYVPPGDHSHHFHQPLHDEDVERWAELVQKGQSA